MSSLKIARSLLRTATFLLLLLYLVIGMLIGLYISGSSLNTPDEIVELGVKFVVCGLIIALWYIFGSGLNDYADYEIDKINLPKATDRPLISGQADKPALLRVSLIAATLTIPLAASLSAWYIVIVLALLLLSVSYSIPPFSISRRGGLAPLLLPLGYIILPFGLGMMLSSDDFTAKPVLLLTAAYYFHFIGRIILKDYRDVKGDKANGKMTFLLRHGNRSVCLVSAISITISTGLILVALNEYAYILRFGFVYLLFFGLVTLYETSKATRWSQQKPLLAAFGRTMTGITALTILTLCNAIWGFSALEQVAMLVGILGVYTWSAQQASRYNTAQTR